MISFSEEEQWSAKNCSGFTNKRNNNWWNHFAAMRVVNSLTKSNMDKALAVNNSMVHEQSSMQEATRQVVHILYDKYEKADL